ncbi:MAG: AAC(3) family N-acetyltransferase [Ilumatobacteraceae bacterium]
MGCRRRWPAHVGDVARGRPLTAVGRPLAITFDCSDPARLARFWSALVGGRIDPRTESAEWVALTEVPVFGNIGFQRVPEGKSVKNRVHLDVEVDGLTSSSASAEGLGATRVGEIVDEGISQFQVMCDPEGNEFCLLRRTSPSSKVPLTGHPWTRREIVDMLHGLGLRIGDTLIVHSSLSAMGYVVGGAQTVVDALIEVVGEAGTVTMPAHSADWSNPARWEAPPVPEEWWQVIRDETPAYDPRRTPVTRMGAIPEAFLLRSETVRSGHPRLSHMALGARAEEIVAHHPLDEGFGPDSPLGRLSDLDAKVVLLGVGHEHNTSLHHAESLAEWPGKCRVVQGSRVLVDDVSTWVVYEETNYDSEDFASVGAAFDTAGGVVVGEAAGAVVKVMSMRDLVDFAVEWFAANRG